MRQTSKGWALEDIGGRFGTRVSFLTILITICIEPPTTDGEAPARVLFNQAQMELWMVICGSGDVFNGVSVAPGVFDLSYVSLGVSGRLRSSTTCWAIPLCGR